MTQQTENNKPERSGSWWHYPHMWLVVGLPLVAVVASFTSLYFALRAGSVDTVYGDPRRPQDGSAPITQSHMLPAEEFRNHAATGGRGAPGLGNASAGGSDSKAPVDD